MKPTIGRIVHYALTADDVVAIDRRRTTNASISARLNMAGPQWHAGAQAHIGNSHSAGQVLPMIICVVWPNEYGPNFDGVNGQVFLDGNDALWVASIKEGTEPGTWRWPERT
jgi:hypothetical protein